MCLDRIYPGTTFSRSIPARCTRVCVCVSVRVCVCVCVCYRPINRCRIPSLLFMFYIYIYIYIYTRVCVCVCGRGFDSCLSVKGVSCFDSPHCRRRQLGSMFQLLRTRATVEHLSSRTSAVLPRSNQHRGFNRLSRGSLAFRPSAVCSGRNQRRG